MGGYVTFAHFGSFELLFNFSHCLKAFSLQSSNHSGSSFFCEINLTIDSSNPLGASSVSTSVVNPHLYSIPERSVSLDMLSGVGIISPKIKFCL